MRMWMVPPETMCRQHLLGEHVELHMFVGTIKKGRGIDGFLEQRILEPFAIEQRHEALVAEMTRRGYNHKSPLYSPALPLKLKQVTVDAKASLTKLLRRCPECSALHSKIEKQ
ncbi:MAG: hypothetical protein A2Y38_19845 [Spirochaetes bacterium GWB1_59_5]|nr:MAG: hypothetical protein A2Y38_19845 [Spirochaetes bacterium GWB1_59_5]